MIDILIRNERSPTTTTSDTNTVECAATDSEILANVKTFFAAGSETASVTISWATYEIAQNVDLHCDILTEIESFYRHYLTTDNTSNMSLTPEDIWNTFSVLKMPLLFAVIKECLRLYSPAPVALYQCESESESHILSNGLEVKPSDQIVIVHEMCLLSEEVKMSFLFYCVPVYVFGCVIYTNNITV